MNIGRVAAASGISAKMIRHYESIGLIRPAMRGASGYRHYSESDVAVLGFIKRARALNFPTKDIKRLLALWQGHRPSAEVKNLALAHIAELDATIADLQRMRDGLRALTDHCHGDEHPNCAILDDLSLADR
jgi:MerR family copper efflux transcriptional regulator